jgi:hypothetical protein
LEFDRPRHFPPLVYSDLGNPLPPLSLTMFA